MKRKRPHVLIVGAGGLARAAARAWGRSGTIDVTVAARRPAAAAAIARGARGVRAVASIEEAARDAGIVLLAVPDGAIASVARALAAARTSWRGVVVLHAAGAQGPGLLRALAARGAATGVLHPLAALGKAGDTVLEGSAARIEGAAAAVRAAKRLAAAAGLRPLRARSLASAEGRLAYHAAASLASNDVVALLASAERLLISRGVPAPRARAALATLAAGAVAQVRRFGPLGAMTGPAVRGDGPTLRSHLALLDAADPEAGAAHRALSLRLARLAGEAGRLDAAAVRTLRRDLARGRTRRRTV